MSAIFYHNEEQKRQAMESLKRQQTMKGTGIYTEILPASSFHRAEEYHQKYFLRQRKEIVGILKKTFPSEDGFMDATAAARLNGYFGGYLSLHDLEAELNDSGLSTEDKKWIMDSLHASARQIPSRMQDRIMRDLVRGSQ
jgi:peptide-methionine (S)-S-oxide reductase